MATIISITRDTLINAALRKIGVLSEGVSANSSQLSTGSEALNLLLAHLQTKTLPLWKRNGYPVPLIENQVTYDIGEGRDVDTPMPLKVLEAFFTSSTTSQRDLQILADYDFKILPTNAAASDPVSISYQPKIGYGTLSVWPAPSDDSAPGYGILLIFQESVDTMPGGTDVFSYPQEWGNTVVYGLASLLADEYMLPLMDRKYIDAKAEKYLEEVLAFGAEDGSVFFTPTGR